MSKVAKQLIFILAIVLLGLLGYSGYLTMQNNDLAKSRALIEKQINDFESRETDQLKKYQDLQQKVKAAEDARAEIEAELEKFVGIDVDQMTEQIKELKAERGSWQEKVQALTQEREDLLGKLDKKTEELHKLANVQAAASADAAITSQNAAADFDLDVMKGLDGDDEIYWAQILKEKTALELEVEKLRSNLSQTAVQVTELKKKNSDLQLELTKIINEKEDVERQVKYGKDLSNSLSLELARAQNEKKFLNDRLVKINDENDDLRGKIKELTSTKIALEKSIVKLQDQKKEVEQKLLETENVIQGRIDEIWEIKKSLDESFGAEAKNNNQVELPPIIVSSEGTESEEISKVKKDVGPGFNGNIVSVNNDNNFVIIDIGQDQGVSLGHNLNVYRGAEYVAGLEVIQVREDIAAADIISKVTDIKIGDAVR